MKQFIAAIALLSACSATVDAGTAPAVISRIAALESKVAILEMQIAEIQKTYFGVLPSGKPLTSAPGMPGYALDSAQRGAEAKEECAEMRTRIWPVFSQGADANAKMVACFGKTCP